MIKMRIHGVSIWQSILLMPMLVSSLGIHLICAQTAAKEDGSSKAHFDMGPRFTHVPEGYFLLVRKGRQIGAIRISKVVEDSLGNGKSTYVSYFQGDGSGSFLTKSVVTRSGEINIMPMKGIHAFAWQPGQNRLWVGKWWFGCYSPSLVNMSSHFSEEDTGFEFAPTSAREIGEVDASSKELRWFGYIPDATASLPVSNLPK